MAAVGTGPSHFQVLENLRCIGAWGSPLPPLPGSTLRAESTAYREYSLSIKEEPMNGGTE